MRGLEDLMSQYGSYAMANGVRIIFPGTLELSRSLS